MEFKVFECALTKSKIQYYINTREKYAIMEIILPENNKTYEHHAKYFKFFCVVLRQSINELKKMGIKKIQQYVPIEELPFLKKNTKWNIISTAKTSVIECAIDACIDNIVDSLGIKL